MFIPISRNKSFRRTLLAGALLLTSAGVSYGDYNAGSSAFRTTAPLCGRSPNAEAMTLPV